MLSVLVRSWFFMLFIIGGWFCYIVCRNGYDYRHAHCDFLRNDAQIVLETWEISLSARKLLFTAADPHVVSTCV